MSRLYVRIVCGVVTLALMGMSFVPLQAQAPEDEALTPSIYLPYVSFTSGQQADEDAEMIVTYLDDVSVDAAASPAATWSRERMLAAQPLPLPTSTGDLPDVTAAGAFAVEESSEGEPVYYSGGQPLKESAELVRKWYPDEWTRIEAGSQEARSEASVGALPSLPFISHYVTNPTYGGNLLFDENPWHLMGVLFFEVPGQGDFRCSGGVAYNRTIWTAGHCVFSPGIGWHANMVFVPAYQNGSSPFGVFTMYNMATLNPWAYEANYAYDIGMVAVGDVNGLSLGETVGWLGAAFNLMPWQLLYNSFGFPSNLDNNGRYLMTCVGDRWLREDAVGPDPVAIGCDMTFGSSGGPWLVNFYPFRYGAYNYVNGVNSYGYNGVDLMYSPYFGSNAQSLFNNWGKLQ